MTAEATLFGEGVELGEGGASPRRFVEVAIDAAGGGGSRLYTYHLPEALADVADGEAVLVEYGRRQALGVVLGTATAAGDRATKPVLERVRADGPLLPPLTIALARQIADTYLAPPALVLRAMLPPGFLERLELIAEVAPDGEAPRDLSSDDRAILDQLSRAPSSVRDIPAPGGRGALIRRLRALEREGRITLDWTLTAAAGGPRFERWVRLTDDGRRVADGTRALEGRPLGPRQQDVLRDLAAAGAAGLAAAALSDAHGTSALPGLVRRGLVDVEVRRRERLALAHRPPGRRGARPPGSDLTAEQAAAVAAIGDALAARDPTPLLLAGATGAGKTAVYVEAIAAALAQGRPGARARARDRTRTAARRPHPRRSRRVGVARAQRAQRGRARRRMASDPRR